MNKQKLIPRKSPIQRRVQYAKIGDEVRNDTEYTVDAWDSLYSIAQKYGISAEKLAEYNGISEDDSLQYGQILKIPSATKNYLNMSDKEFEEPVVRRVAKTDSEKYAEGEDKATAPTPVTSGGAVAPYSYHQRMSDTSAILHQLMLESISGNLMNEIRGVGFYDTLIPLQFGLPREPKTYGDDADHYGGVAQRTYLLPSRTLQRAAFEREEYTYIEPVNDELYGLVKNGAVELNNRGGRGGRIPIYQKNPNAISPDKLIPIEGSFMYDRLSSDDMLYGDDTYNDIYHAGSYPTKLYYDPETRLVYIQQWDLNDYGDASNPSGTQSESDFINRNKLANVLDWIGLPTVTYSGVLPFKRFGKQVTLDNVMYYLE